MSFNKFIRSILIKLFGIIIIKNRHKDYGFNKILTKIVSDDQPIIFDIGASEGSSYERYKKIFSNPIIHSFEPLSNEFDIMKKKFNEDNNLFLNNVAVGSKSEIKIFNKIAKTGRSSFYKSSIDELSNQEQIEVRVETIDSYMKKNNIQKINILKIDVQGFEDEVLKGAKETLQLNKIDIIETELIVGNMYERALSFNEIEKLIYPYGYKFFALTNHHNKDRHSDNIIERPRLQFDLIYTRNDIYKKYAKIK